VISAKKRSTRLSQLEPVGVKCRWNLGCLSSHALTAGVLWVARLSRMTWMSWSAGTLGSIVCRKPGTPGVGGGV
jgi:hypothetical protein